MNEKPYIVDETDNFAVAFKPPRMHSVPLRKGGGDTMLDWYAALFPPIMEISGRRAGEGGLLHRLDYETQGLMLFAKNQKSLDHLLAAQEEGNFIKEYAAICHKNVPANASYPAPNSPFSFTGFVIESYFRPFGPGRKQVRPALDNRGKGRSAAQDRNGCYRTEIASVAENDYCHFALRLRRGFRHQIRCHLAWIGCPILNDPLYGEQPASDDYMALRASGLIFADPQNGIAREYRIESFGNH
ncbi:MAG: RNA pseudouridine synthase [Treponema sp.]|jgi:23S rRNA pseudouridine1911/1915/1917 synthase|nr:RNA pseudouridine synthase [Treponema sp.]